MSSVNVERHVSLGEHVRRLSCVEFYGPRPQSEFCHMSFMVQTMLRECHISREGTESLNQFARHATCNSFDQDYFRSQLHCEQGILAALDI